MRGLGTKNNVEDVNVAVPYTSAYTSVMCGMRFFVFFPDIAGGVHFAHRGYG